MTYVADILVGIIDSFIPDESCPSTLRVISSIIGPSFPFTSMIDIDFWELIFGLVLRVGSW